MFTSKLETYFIKIIMLIGLCGVALGIAIPKKPIISDSTFQAINTSRVYYNMANKSFMSEDNKVIEYNPKILSYKDKNTFKFKQVSKTSQYDVTIKLTPVTTYTVEKLPKFVYKITGHHHWKNNYQLSLSKYKSIPVVMDKSKEQINVSKSTYDKLTKEQSFVKLSKSSNGEKLKIIDPNINTKKESIVQYYEVMFD